ncbi:MAG TPA: hypothetical protein VKP64_15795, partial [Mycobacteriales bacterium]|nr:hypothetical protein [Mycobacteriales bacterium]
SGFADIGPAGQAAQRQLLRLAREGGMRLIGPNCLGLLNTDPQTRLNATFAPTPPRPGTVAMLSQSGGLGIALLERTAALKLGVSSFVSIGNRADVSANDLLLWWEQDVRTRVVVLYLGVLRQSPEVRPDRSPALPPQADRRNEGRQLAGRVACRTLAHRGCGNPRRHRRGAVPPGRRHRRRFAG